jgi:hypothetical protein
MIQRYLFDGALHRIERIDMAGQRRHLQQPAERLRNWLTLDVLLSLRDRESCHGHSILRECAGLVDAKHGGRTERLDGRIRRVSTWLHAMRQAPSARNTVSTTGNSSGISDIASAMPANRPSTRLPRARP